jgi:hypothetical protein
MCGGILELALGPQPNETWTTSAPPPSPAPRVAASVTQGHSPADAGFQLAPVLPPAINDAATQATFTLIDGSRAPEVVELEFRTDMGGVPAYTGGSRISLNASWIASQLQGEAKGCVVHELCHVVQNYRQVLRVNPQATLSPAWVTEGLADYISCRAANGKRKLGRIDDVFSTH